MQARMTMRAMPRRLAMCLALALAFGASHAEAAGCDVTLSADGNTAAVQRHLDAAGKRAPRVCLRPGHYQGARLIISRSAELRAVGEGRVVLDAGGRGRALTVVQPGIRFVISGVTLTEGSVENGGAIAIEAASTVRLVDCWLTRNKAGSHGGAAFVSAGTLELVQSRVSANAAMSGSALWVEGGGRLLVASSVVHDNKSRGGVEDAPIVVRPGSALELLASTVAYNPGHGVFVAPAGPKATPARLRVDSAIVMGAPDAIHVDRVEAGAAHVHRSVLYGRIGYLPLDPACRRELPVFDLENVERYRPTYGSPAMAIGRCDHPDTRRDVAGVARPLRCTAGGIEADAVAIRKTVSERQARERSEQSSLTAREPELWPSDDEL